MQPQYVTIRLPIELARRHGIEVQAIIRAYNMMSAEKARQGDVRAAMKLAQRSEDESQVLEAVELGIAQRPLPLYVFDEAMVVRE